MKILPKSHTGKMWFYGAFVSPLVSASIVGCTISSTVDDLTPSMEAPVEAVEAPETTEAPAETIEPSTDYTDIAEGAYLDTLDAGDIYYTSDKAAIDLGYAICDGIDSGLTLTQIAGLITKNGGYSTYDAGYIFGAANVAFCPTSAVVA